MAEPAEPAGPAAHGGRKTARVQNARETGAESAERAEHAEGERGAERTEPALAATGWRRAPAPLAVLRVCGWLGAGDVPVQVLAAQSSHHLHRVRRADGACAVVKQVPEHAARAGRSLKRELFVHRLAGWLPGVARALPKALHLDEHRQVLATESLSSAPAWPADNERGAIDDPVFAAALGRVLAGVHRATRALPMPPTPAVGVLGLPQSLQVASTDRPASTRALMRRIVAEPSLAALLNEGAARYQPGCVVHGDLKTENWLRRGRRSAAIFDWELAGQGDPAWDLGCLVAEAGLLCLRRAWSGADKGSGLGLGLGLGLGSGSGSGYGLGSTAGAAAGHDAAVRLFQAPALPALHALWRAYAGVVGHGPRALIDLASTEANERVVLYAVARWLHVACEWADHEQGTGPDSAASTSASDSALALALSLAPAARRATWAAALQRQIS